MSQHYAAQHYDDIDLPARCFILAVLMSAVAFAEPTTAPSLSTLVRALGDRDAIAREHARDTLMGLSREDLPDLLAATRSCLPLTFAQRAALHEVVVQVFLAGEHHFEGEGNGFVGILLGEFSDEYADETAAAAGHGVVVKLCFVGFDSYRTLQVGDVITAIARPASGLPDANLFKPVKTRIDIRSALQASHPGEWVDIRFQRNGVAHETRSRLGPETRIVDGIPANDYDTGDAYWVETFAPALASSTDLPATQPANESAGDTGHRTPARVKRRKPL